MGRLDRSGCRKGHKAYLAGWQILAKSERHPIHVSCHPVFLCILNIKGRPVARISPKTLQKWKVSSTLRQLLVKFPLGNHGNSDMRTN